MSDRDAWLEMRRRAFTYALRTVLRDFNLNRSIR